MTSGSTNFPGSLDSHTGASPLGMGEVNNQAYTQATASHTNSVTTITVASTALFPSKGFIVVKREIISYTGTTATTFTGCTRGVGGTTAAAFLAGTLVEQVVVAANHNDVAAGLVAVETELAKRRHAEILINSNFDHWQRGSSARTNTTTYSKDTSYAADRFFALPAGASITTQRSTTVPDANSRYSALLTGASSVTTVDYGQRLTAQAVNTQCLRSLVFSCYVRNVSGAAFTPTLRIGTPGSADDFTTVTNRLAQTLQECADSAWTRVYHVFDPSAYTNVANGIEVCLRIPSGSLVSGDTVYISQFSLKPGIALSPYTPPDPDIEILRALRYYRVLQALGQYSPFGFGDVSTATTVDAVIHFPEMRTAPAVTFGPTAGDFTALVGGGGYAASSIAVTPTTTILPHAIFARATLGVSITTYIAAKLASTDSDAYIQLNAEL